MAARCAPPLFAVRFNMREERKRLNDLPENRDSHRFLSRKLLEIFNKPSSLLLMNFSSPLVIMISNAIIVMSSKKCSNRFQSSARQDILKPWLEIC